MKLRTMPRVLRIHKSSKKRGFEEVYSELLLFYPWRNEEIDINRHRGEGLKDIFNSNRDVISKNKKSIFPHSETIQELAEIIETLEDIRPQHIGELLDGNAEQENLDVEKDTEPIDMSELPTDSTESNHKEKFYFKPILVEEEDKMRKMARQLSFEQMVVFCKMIDYFKRILISKNCAVEIVLEPPLLIVHGKLSLH